jgi:3-methylcrotonyl-CoA carboxylase alpha subunit
MNTRLQVEHPVTEIVTGVDLVELQIRLAGGERLPVSQDDVHVRGWAIEARINCENPARGWRPELGEVARYREPEMAGLRIDSGIAQGSRITPHYDSLVAKAIGHGATRGEAADRLSRGLAAFEADGIGTNQAFLRAVIDAPLFRSGRLTTGFLNEAFGDGGWQPPDTVREQACIAAALHALRLPGSAGRDPWRAAGGFRLVAASGSSAAAAARVMEPGGAATRVSIARHGDSWRANVGDRDVEFAVSQEDGRLRIAAQGQAPRLWSTRDDGDAAIVAHAGMQWHFSVAREVDALAAEAAGDDGVQHGNAVTATMPGVVTTVDAEPGREVAAGDVLVVMEAMKLVFHLSAPRAGRIARVACRPGDVVAQGEVLVEIAAD